LGVRIVRLGSSRASGEGLRIGTVRRPPRAVPKSAYSSALDLLAALSHRTNFSVGCHCEDENHCHRSVPRELLAKRGAHLV